MAADPKILDYGVFDADNHYYEPIDMFARYIDPRYSDRTFTVHESDGGSIVVFDGRPFGFIGGSGNTKRIRPGMLRAGLRGEAPPDDDDDDVDDTYVADPAARVALMDRQGIDGTLMFPSTGVTIENALGTDPDLIAAHVRAFNRWLAETWTFNYRNRIFSPALINLTDPDAAVAELELVLAHGTRAIQILPGPALWSSGSRPGRSPADPVYDPFWARVEEAQALVCFHLGNSGYMERQSLDWGENPDPDGIRATPAGRSTGDLITGRSAFQWTMLYRDRPIMDTLAILIYHNLFGRFPNLNVASVENGAIWVPYLLRVMDNMKGMARKGPWPNGYVEGRPSDIFKRHIYISPHHYGEEIAALIDLIGADHVLFGSDFPHAEGMSGISDYRDRANEFAANLGQPVEPTRCVMRENGFNMVGPS